MAERWQETTEHYLHDLREIGEKAWEATQRGVATAGQQAARMGKLASRRLDLSSLDRKLGARCAELGRIVATAWEEGTYDLRSCGPALRVLAEVEELRHDRYALLREMAKARAEEGSRHESEARVESARAEAVEEERHL